MRISPLILTAILLISIIFVGIPVALGTFQITTDKDTYSPGDYMSISGSGATPYSAISLQLYDPNDNRIKIDQTTAGGDGTFTLSNFHYFTSSSTPGTYTIKAYEATQKVWSIVTVTLIVPDTTPPTISDISPGNTTVTLGSTATITATVTDDTEVESVTLYYKRAWETTYTSASMSSVGTSNQYGYTLTNIRSPTTYYIQAVDTSDNSATSDTYKIMVTSTLLASTNKEEYNPGDTITVTGSGATAYAEVTIRLYDPSNVEKAVTQTTSLSDGTFTLSNLYTFESSDLFGTWQVCVYESVLEQWSNISITLTSLDTTPPTIVDVSPGDTTVLSGSSVTITATITDNVELSTVTLYYKEEDESAYVPVTMTETGVPNQYGYTLTTTTVSINYYISAVDNSSNIASTTIYTITVYVDTTPPVIGDISPGNTTVANGSSVIITVTVTDDWAVSLVTLYYKSEGETSYTSVTMGLAEVANQFEYTLSSLRRDVTYYITARDSSSNLATSSNNTISILKDTTPPTIVDVSPGDTTVLSGSSVTITATVTDNAKVSEVNLYYKNVTSTVYVEARLSETEVENQYSYTLTNLAQSIHYYISATDNSSNTALSSSYTITVVIDETPPIITSITPGDTTILQGSSVTITAYVSDNVAVSSVVLYYKGEGERDYTSAPMSLRAGNFTGRRYAETTYTFTADRVRESIIYYINATDTSGNSAISAIYTITVYVDTAPPTVTDVDPENIFIRSGSSVTIRVTVTDDWAVNSVILYYKGEGEASYTSVTMTGTGTPNQYSYTLSRVTRNTYYYIVAIDTSSNTATTSIYIIITQSLPRIPR